MTTTGPDKAATGAWLPAFGAVALIWGTSFMFIKIAVDELPPVYLALTRIGLGALTLVIFLLARRQSMPRDRRLWAHLFVFATFGSSIPFVMFGYAEERVSSVLAGIWNGTVPLTTLAVTLLLLSFGRGAERPSRQQLAGLLLGFVGVLVVLGVWQGVGGSSLTGQFALFVAVACYGIGFNYTRWILARWKLSALQLSAGQTIMSTLQLLVAAPLIAGAPPAPSSLAWSTVGAVAVLGVLGTGLAFVLNWHVVQTAGVTTGSMVTYLPPVVAAVAGVVLLNEHLSWYQPVGGVIVLLGVGVSQGLVGLVTRRARGRRTRTTVDPTNPAVAVASSTSPKP